MKPVATPMGLTNKVVSKPWFGFDTVFVFIIIVEMFYGFQKNESTEKNYVHLRILTNHEKN